MKKVIEFFKNEDGMELVEYALMTFLIAIGVALIIGAVGDRILAIFTDLLTNDLGGTAPAQ